MRTKGNTEVKTHTVSLMGRAHQLSQVLSVLLLLFGFHVTSAHSQDGHSHSGEAHQDQAKKSELPKTLPGLLIAIRDHQAELHEALKANELEGVHEIAFSIRDYVAALPDKSKLSGDKKKLLKTYVTNVSSLAELLDQAGDAGDSAAVATLVDKLDLKLQSVDALYAVKDVRPAANAAATDKQMYVCPMHPEVTSDKAGDCSKCGMALVKKDK